MDSYLSDDYNPIQIILLDYKRLMSLYDAYKLLLAHLVALNVSGLFADVSSMIDVDYSDFGLKCLIELIIPISREN